MQKRPLPHPLYLQAVDPARNIARGYSIWMVPDLFGAWIVETRWGRIGTRGQMLARSFPDPASARIYVRAILRRRDGAKKRLGVAYRRVTETKIPERLIKKDKTESEPSKKMAANAPAVFAGGASG